MVLLPGQYTPAAASRLQLFVVSGAGNG